MYTIETKLAAAGSWHTPAQAQAYYGRYSRSGITIHWWGGGEPASKHDAIVNYFLSQGKLGKKSVNYVVSDNKITLMVHPDNVAWTSQSGNPTTISIECQPTLGAEGYKKVGWLIKELEGRYNPKGLALYPHKHWFATACPGSLDLNRMRAEANKWKAGGYNPVPAPAPTPPAQATLSWTKFTSNKVFVTNKQPTHLWDFNNTKWSMTSKAEFPKGHQVTTYGQCVNETLGATYYLTEYSYTKKITNGFNVKDLDPFVAPTPTPPEPPKPPEPEPPQPDNPPPPVEPDISWIKRALQAILNFLGIKI